MGLAVSNFTCEHCGLPIMDTLDGYRTGCEHYPADPTPVMGRISFAYSPRRQRTFTDDELTEIYNRANGITDGKAPPITTQRIFAAMRAMLELK